MGKIINDPVKLDELKKINKTIIHDDELDSFDNQLLSLISGTYDANYPFILSDNSECIKYIDSINDDNVLVMNVSTATKIKDKHPESYAFLSKTTDLLNDSILAMDSLTESESKVILLNEMIDNNPMIATCRLDKKHAASNPQIYLNEITSIYDKDNFINLIERTWNMNKVFSKNKKIEEYLIKSTWLQLPTDLMFALSNSYDSESFNKSQVEYDLEIKRIDDFIIKLISDKDGVCNGYISSNIVSSNDLINSLVNIRRMDNPLDFVDPYLSSVFEDDKLGDIVNNNLLDWDYEPIFDSDLSACLKAIQDGVIDGIYDFTNWDNKININDNSISDVLDELENDGVVVMSDYNNKILHDLGLSDSVLNEFIVNTDDLLFNTNYLKQVHVCDYQDAEWSVTALYDGDNYFFTKDELLKLDSYWDEGMGDNSAIVFNDDGSVFLHDSLQGKDFQIMSINGLYKFPISWNWIERSIMSQKDEFNNYCKNKTETLPVSDDAFGNNYPTIMKCTINDLPNCSVVYVDNKVDSLCYIDEDKQLHIDKNTTPDYFAVQMNFDKIDKSYLSLLNDYWDGLNLDEVMNIYKNRENLKEDVINTKEGKEV